MTARRRRSRCRVGHMRRALKWIRTGRAFPRWVPCQWPMAAWRGPARCRVAKSSLLVLLLLLRPAGTCWLLQQSGAPASGRSRLGMCGLAAPAPSESPKATGRPRCWLFTFDCPAGVASRPRNLMREFSSIGPRCRVVQTVSTFLLFWCV